MTTQPGTYIATTANGLILELHDNPDLVDPIASHVLDWLKHGYTVRYEAGRAVPVASNGHVPDKPAKRPYHHRAKQDAISELDGFTLGDKVHLAWSQLSEDQRLHWSQYRNDHGTVDELRRGLGVQKRIGCRFNGDPELIWLRSAEVSHTPEIGE